MSKTLNVKGTPAVAVQRVVRDSDPRYSHREISMAVMQCCTCGGGGPDDKHTCPACHVYHALATIPNDELKHGAKNQ